MPKTIPACPHCLKIADVWTEKSPDQLPLFEMGEGSPQSLALE